jgi:hypothetical protein
MSIFFSVLSAAYIAGIFLFADSPVVSDIAPFNPYSLLHIPLYGILTLLLILSNWSSIFLNKRNPINSRSPIDPKNSINSMSPTNPINPTNSINPINLSRETRSLFHWDPINLLIAGFIAFVVAIADEIHQAYVPARDASITDVLLDVVGIIFCLFLIQRMEHRSGFSKIAGFLRRIS